MTLIVIEGDNAVGKTTLLKQLGARHPHLKLFAYPTKGLRETLKPKQGRRSLDDMFAHHYRFLEDFANFNSVLKRAARKNTVLLDRYFFTNAVYFLEEFSDYTMKRRMKAVTEEARLAKQLVNEVLNPFYSELVQPDLVIYLQGMFTGYKSIPLTYNFYFNNTHYPIEKIVHILARQPTTTGKAEEVLKRLGFLK